MPHAFVVFHLPYYSKPPARFASFAFIAECRVVILPRRCIPRKTPTPKITTLKESRPPSPSFSFFFPCRHGPRKTRRNIPPRGALLRFQGTFSLPLILAPVHSPLSTPPDPSFRLSISRSFHPAHSRRRPSRFLLFSASFFFFFSSLCAPRQLVCMSGKWNKNSWKGPHRSATGACFERWTENLYLGINDADADADDATTTKMRKTIEVQRDGGYQNEFLFAERCAAGKETCGLWEALRVED
jgi:hypothetical protein